MQYIHPRHRPLVALLRWLRRAVLALFSVLVMNAQGQSVRGPWQSILNNTPGEREWLFTGQGKQMNMWYLAQVNGAHEVRVFHGKNVPVSLNVRDCQLVLHFANAIDTLRHVRPYAGTMRDAMFSIPTEAWEHLLNKPLLSATLVDGHGTLVRELNAAEAALLRDTCSKVDTGPIE